MIWGQNVDFCALGEPVERSTLSDPSPHRHRAFYRPDARRRPHCLVRCAWSTLLGHDRVDFERPASLLCGSVFERDPVDICLTLSKPHGHIQRIGCLAAWPRRQIDRRGPKSIGMINRSSHECFCCTDSSSLFVNDDVFNERFDPRRNGDTDE